MSAFHNPNLYTVMMDTTLPKTVNISSITSRKRTPRHFMIWGIEMNELIRQRTVLMRFRSTLGRLLHFISTSDKTDTHDLRTLAW